jgi:predicted nucleic acid-binding protein
MILADTSILIEFVRKPSLPVARVVLSGKPVVCGVSVAEMQAGVRSEAHGKDVAATLRLFGQLPIDEPVWALTGRISRAMARRGTKVKFQDAVIAATAIHRDLPLWSRDRHFTWVQASFPELKLFDENNA